MAVTMWQCLLVFCLLLCNQFLWPRVQLNSNRDGLLLQQIIQLNDFHLLEAPTVQLQQMVCSQTLSEFDRSKFHGNGDLSTTLT